MAEQNPTEAPRRRRIKKSKSHGGHHGGAWKVAYADFVTAMMALFLVLWLVSQADTQLKEQIANYFRSPGVFDSMDGGILSQAKKVSKEPSDLTSKDDEQALFSVAQNLKKKFTGRLELARFKDQVKIEMTEEGLTIQLLDKAESVSFPSGSAELTPNAQKILAEIAVAICELPNKVNIGGHTDRHVFPGKTGYTNWELSTDRANAARRVLENGCVKPAQINRIVGYADTEPLIPEDPFAEANRRISITVLRLIKPTAGDDATSDSTSSDSDSPRSSVPAGQPGTKPAAIPFKSIPVEEKNAASAKAENVKSAEPTDKSDDPASQPGTEGAVRVGEPDKVPSRPVIKEPRKRN